MSENYRYIKLFSNVLSNCFFQKKPFDEWHAFEYFILRARYKPVDFMLSDCSIIHLERGQHFESVVSLSERFGWSEKKVRTFLGKAQRLGMLRVKGMRKGQLITVVKYDFYQDSGRTDGESEEQQEGKQKSNQQDTLRATRGQSEGRSKNKEIERIEGDRKRYIYGEYKHVQLTADEYQRLTRDFGQDLTDRAIKVVDEYVESSGKKYKNYNLTIRKWGIESARKEEEKNAGSASGGRISAEQYYRELSRQLHSEGNKDQTVQDAG